MGGLIQIVLCAMFFNISTSKHQGIKAETQIPPPPINFHNLILQMSSVHSKKDALFQYFWMGL